jgi:hypothetical protein
MGKRFGGNGPVFVVKGKFSQIAGESCHSFAVVDLSGNPQRLAIVSFEGYNFNYGFQYPLSQSLYQSNVGVIGGG